MFALWFDEWNIVSSAKSDTFDPSSMGISLVYIEYRRGAKQEPCGTPAKTGRIEDEWPSILTEKVLFVRKESMIWTRLV